MWDTWRVCWPKLGRNHTQRRPSSLRHQWHLMGNLSRETRSAVNWTILNSSGECLRPWGVRFLSWWVVSNLVISKVKNCEAVLVFTISCSPCSLDEKLVSVSMPVCTGEPNYGKLLILCWDERVNLILYWVRPFKWKLLNNTFLSCGFIDQSDSVSL